MTAKYRNQLDKIFALSSPYLIAYSSLETLLIFAEEKELPCYASFVLVKSEEGRDRIRRFYEEHIRLAISHQRSILLDTVGWRANSDWAGKLGIFGDELDDLNRKSVELMVDLQRSMETPGTKIVLSGSVGPRGDGYRTDFRMTPAEAQQYHAHQINVYRDSAIDIIVAYTLTYLDEALGITLAARSAQIPIALSFTLETNGCLPSKESLRTCIEEIDAKTGAWPMFYMVNCIHPIHFIDLLRLHREEPWVKRIRGFRCNASKLSHEELDNAATLDDGDPVEFGSIHRALREVLPHVVVMGGCCGTDIRHISQICQQCTA